MKVIIKKIDKTALNEALSLVWRVFQEYEAPDYTQQGIDEFYNSIHDESFLSKLSMFGAFVNEELVGVIATRNNGTHIALLFVDGNYHRQDIGRKLFQKVLEQSTASRVTVNSSPFAVHVYRKLGFIDTDKEQTVNGLRFTPMAYIGLNLI